MKRFIVVLMIMVGLTGSVNAQTGGGSEPSTPEIVRAAEQGDMATVEKRLAAGESVDAQDRSRGWSALMAVAQTGRGDAVRYLLEHGASVNLRDNRGWTALMLAAGCGDCDVIEVLLAAGADAFATNQDGLTAYDIALKANRRNVVRFLRDEAGIIGPMTE
jgi:ankyrin repeat protein